jgi:hypothetical protein
MHSALIWYATPPSFVLSAHTPLLSHITISAFSCLRSPSPSSLSARSFASHISLCLLPVIYPVPAVPLCYESLAYSSLCPPGPQRHHAFLGRGQGGLHQWVSVRTNITFLCYFWQCLRLVLFTLLQTLLSPTGLSCTQHLCGVR